MYVSPVTCRAFTILIVYLVNGSTTEAGRSLRFRSSGANGRRSMVLDIKKTNPQGMGKD